MSIKKYSSKTGPSSTMVSSSKATDAMMSTTRLGHFVEQLKGTPLLKLLGSMLISKDVAAARLGSNELLIEDRPLIEDMILQFLRHGTLVAHQ
jgi:hypothetical protein